MHESKLNFYKGRFFFVIALMVLAIIGLFSRVFFLAVYNQNFLRQQGDERSVRTVMIPAFRGIINDRNGIPLAISTEVYSVWIDPVELSDNSTDIKTLASLLKISPSDINQLAKKKIDKAFIYLKRGISPMLAEKIEQLKIEGVYLQKEYRRYYPDGEVTAHLLGMTDVDDHGQEGIELRFNDWLQGENGKHIVVKDRMHRIISDKAEIKSPRAGKDLTLSIDRNIQYFAYRELLSGVLANQAESGSAVVADVKTGEILALVNYPSFNPNQKHLTHANAVRNRAVTDSFEPGSTMKPFGVTAALMEHQIKTDSIFDTSPGFLRIGKHIVQDEHNTHYLLSVTQILQISSNVGMTKILERVSPHYFWNLLHNIGIGEPSGIGLLGEPSGVLVEKRFYDPFTMATIGFGYALSVNALQLIHAYHILANAGIKKPLSILKVNEEPKGTRVIPEKVAKDVLQILEAVLQKGGTGFAAQVPNYRVAGKSGTSRLLINGVYQKHRHLSLFVGVAPLTSPRYVVLVTIRDPHGKKYFGGDVAGPVFSHIMEGLLRMKNIPPDGITASSQQRSMQNSA